MGGDGPLGVVVDPADPEAVASALRSLLGLSPADCQALQARCLAAAHNRWNWDTESARLLALYGELPGNWLPAK